MRLSFLIFIQLLLLSPALIAQHERDVWWFGAGVGIDFTSTPPTPVRTPMSAYEGCATLSDGRTGIVLMATDGARVFNANGQVMPNGDGLAGLDNATQSSLILPAPRNPGLYYLFTQDGAAYADPPNTGLSYSLVDMRLDAGLGDVVLRNVSLLPNTAEKLAAVRDTSGCGYWIASHGVGDNNFHVFHLTANGIDSAVVSAVGTPHIDPPGETVGGAAIGWMRFSPAGDRVAVASYSAGIVELFDFDRSTGRLASVARLPNLPYAYGLCFSPDGTKLYVSTNTGNRTPHHFELWQFDVSVPDSLTIASTMSLVASGPDPVARHFGALQIGPDGKIYMARAGDRWLSTISNPNAPGASCGFTRDGFDLGFAGASLFSLPNFVDDIELRGGLDCSLPHADFRLSDTIVCVGSCVGVIDESRNNPTSWEWETPGSALTYSFGRVPEPFCFPTPGRWPVRLVVANSDGADTAERWVTVVEGGVLVGRIESVSTISDTLVAHVSVQQTDRLLAGPITLQANYPPRAIRFLDGVTRGIVHNWAIDLIERDDLAGSVTMRLIPPLGASLDGPGDLADLRFTLYLDSLERIPLSVTLTAAAPGCPAISDSRIDVDAWGCLRQQRLIVFGEGAYGLDGPDPSPASTEAVLHLDLGLDGETTVTILSADGRIVAIPVSSWLPAGPHALRLDVESLPAGLYMVVVRSGDWHDSRRLLVR